MKEQPDNPELPRRNPGEAYINQGLSGLEVYANDPASGLSPHAREEAARLNIQLQMPPREPEHRNTTESLAGKVNLNLEVDPSDADWLRSEEASKIGQTAITAKGGQRGRYKNTKSHGRYKYRK